MLAGIFSQWLNVDCQKAWPDVAERISAANPMAWRTGMYPTMLVIGPFCSDAVILPFCRDIKLLTCPTHCAGTVTLILNIGSTSEALAVKKDPSVALRVAGTSCAGPR